MKLSFRQIFHHFTRIEKQPLQKGIENLEAYAQKEKEYFLDKDNLAKFKAMSKQNGTDEKFCF